MRLWGLVALVAATATVPACRESAPRPYHPSQLVARYATDLEARLGVTFIERAPSKYEVQWWLPCEPTDQRGGEPRYPEGVPFGGGSYREGPIVVAIDAAGRIVADHSWRDEGPDGDHSLGAFALHASVIDGTIRGSIDASWRGYNGQASRYDFGCRARDFQFVATARPVVTTELVDDIGPNTVDFALWRGEIVALVDESHRDRRGPAGLAPMEMQWGSKRFPFRIAQEVGREVHILGDAAWIRGPGCAWSIVSLETARLLREYDHRCIGDWGRGTVAPGGTWNHPALVRFDPERPAALPVRVADLPDGARTYLSNRSHVFLFWRVPNGDEWPRLTVSIFDTAADDWVGYELDVSGGEPYQAFRLDDGSVVLPGEYPHAYRISERGDIDKIKAAIGRYNSSEPVAAGDDTVWVAREAYPGFDRVDLDGRVVESIDDVTGELMHVGDEIWIVNFYDGTKPARAWRIAS